MKNIKFAWVLLVFFGLQTLHAQKVGVVDTQYILNKLPQYKEAESRLNNQIETWQTEIKNLQSQYDQKKSAFEAEKVLLIGDQLKQREKEVKDLEENIKTTLSLRFGSNGEIAKLRMNLVQPFQDQIWNAIKTVAEKNALGIVVDKSNETTILFLQKRYDYTDKVLDYITKGTLDRDKKKK